MLPVCEIESVANELLSTLTVRAASIIPGGFVSERRKLPLLSTPFAAKVRLAPVAVMVTFLTVPGVVLSCPVKVMKSKLAAPGRTTMIDATALSVVNGALVPSIVLGATTTAPGMTRVAPGATVTVPNKGPGAVFSVMVKLSLKLSPVMVRGLLGVGNETVTLLKSVRVSRASRFSIRRRLLLVPRWRELRLFRRRCESQVMVGNPQTYETTS